MLTKGASPPNGVGTHDAPDDDDDDDDDDGHDDDDDDDDDIQQGKRNPSLRTGLKMAAAPSSARA